MTERLGSVCLVWATMRDDVAMGERAGDILLYHAGGDAEFLSNLGVGEAVQPAQQQRLPWFRGKLAQEFGKQGKLLNRFSDAVRRWRCDVAHMQGKSVQKAAFRCSLSRVVYQKPTGDRRKVTPGMGMKAQLWLLCKPAEGLLREIAGARVAARSRGEPIQQPPPMGAI